MSRLTALAPIVLAALALGHAGTAQAAQDPAAGKWKQCVSGTKPAETIVTGEKGIIDVLTRPGQSCKVAIRKERWLRVDRGGLTDGWRVRSYRKYTVEDAGHYYVVIFAKGKTRIQMIQYCE